MTISKSEKVPSVSQSAITINRSNHMESNKAWGSDCNKRPDEKCRFQLTSDPKKPLSRLSSKMLQMSADVNSSGSTFSLKKNFSLRRDKSKDNSDRSSVVINSSLITLFKKPDLKEQSDEVSDVVGSVLKEISIPPTNIPSFTADLLNSDKDPFNVEINSIISKLEFDNDDIFANEDRTLQQSSFDMASHIPTVSLESIGNPVINVKPTAQFVTSTISLPAPDHQQQHHHSQLSDNFSSVTHTPDSILQSRQIFTNISVESSSLSSVNPITCPLAKDSFTNTEISPTSSEALLINSQQSNLLPPTNFFTNPATSLSDFNCALSNKTNEHHPITSMHSFAVNEMSSAFDNANSDAFHIDQSFEFATLIPNMIETMNSNQSSSDVVDASFLSTAPKSTYDRITSFTPIASQTVPSYLNLDQQSASSLEQVPTSTNGPMFTPIKKSARFESQDITVEFSPMKGGALTDNGSLLDHVKLLKMPSPVKTTRKHVNVSDNEDLFGHSSDAAEDFDDMPMDTFEGVTSAKQTALFGIHMKPTETKSKVAGMIKSNATTKQTTRRRIKNDDLDDGDFRKDVKTITKSRKKNMQKDANFRRLEFKKKTYSRGHKKFNTQKYKRDEWKKLQSSHGSGCFKCGDPNHWAQDCLRDAVADDNAFDAEMEQLAIEKDINNLSVLPNQTSFSLQFEDPAAEVDQALLDLGFQEFKNNQRETILRIMNGRSVLFISATGSGKSLCYQIPAYLFGKRCNNITLVVSPLISLMEDQILCLPDGIKGCYLHGGLTEGMKRKQMEQIQNGEAHLLFLSPEYIMGNLLELSLLPPIGFVCIDEAHCLSEWSNNFRPSYLQLFKTLRTRLGIRVFLALTATANKHTARQIVRNLGIDLHDIIGQTKIPENLMLTVSRDSNKDFGLIDLLKSDRFCSLRSIIIYCNRREVTERLATLIRMEMQQSSISRGESWNACAYHAGLSYHTRKEIQNRFISGELRVIVATIAFGMGINKSDVSAIIHYNLPKTLENYVQEIGRAGRDGRRAECHLFLDQNGDDLFEQQKHIFSNGVDRSNIRKFVGKLFQPCKCRQLHSIESEDEVIVANNQTSTSDGSDKVKPRKCPGHEKAFSIKETTQELDLKEETILTLLLFLELNCKKFKVNVLNYTNSKCRLYCYRSGGEQMEQLAKRHSFVALPLANHKRLTGRAMAPETLEFSHVNVAAMLGQESLSIRRQLKSLEWDQNPKTGQKSRSSVRVEFSELSFHVISPGDLLDDELDEVSKLLLNYSRAQENKEIESLKRLYETFRELSQQRCSNRLNSVKSRELKRVLNTYFDLQNIAVETEDDKDLQQLSSQATQSQELRPAADAELNEARASIVSLIRLHNDHSFTPRAVARILQGIASPKYPLEVWGRDKRFWRKCLKVDFNALVRIATEELVRYKC